MGSRSTIAKTDLAYIAGFLDGDGSLMLQIKKRKDGKIGARFMATVCLYQDTRHESPLFWIRRRFGIGYISRRNDQITELRVNGFKRVRTILTELIPYIRFKKKQARALHNACRLLSKKSFSKLSKAERRKLVSLILTMQTENYQSRAKKTLKELTAILGLTP